MTTTPTTRRRHAAALLGVPLDASASQIRRAFRHRVRSVHPDGADTPRDADAQTERFTQLCAARDLLLGRRAGPPPEPDGDPGSATSAGLEDFLAIFARRT